MSGPADDALARDLTTLNGLIHTPESQAALDRVEAELQRLRDERDEDEALWQTTHPEFIDYWFTIGRSCSAGDAIRQLMREKEAAEAALAARTHQLGRAEIDNWNLRRALEETLADDGNCTADEPQDPHCPRCKARRVLEALVTAVRVQAEREPGSLDTAIRRALAAADGTPKDTT